MSTFAGNPFEKIDAIESSQKLLDVAFDKAFDIKPPVKPRDPVRRSRDHELNRINTAANVIVDRIERMVNQFPSIDNIHPFYQEMADLYLGVDQLKISLSRVHGITPAIRSIQQDISEQMLITGHKEENRQLRKQAFGRFSSLVYQIDQFLDDLRVGREKLRQLPGFNPTYPTVVITGVPNAGKSSFIRQNTSGKPEIAAYPFTTKSVIFGHRKLKFFNIQFVDTPGLLDRSFFDRNDIELQALLALKYLSDILVFFFDPAPKASSSDEEQLNLLAEIAEFYPAMVLIGVVTKNDLVSEDRIEEAKAKLLATGEFEENLIFSINSTHHGGSDELLKSVENMIMSRLMKSAKFRNMTMLEIDPEFIPEESDPLWDDF